MRVVPDLAFLADIEPGGPVMMNGHIQSIGGTSGSAPFAMSQVGLLSARQRLAGRPRVGFINPWFYQLYKQHPDLFYDVVSGSTDLGNVGCCTATKGFDEVSGLGVPNLGEIARRLPLPSAPAALNSAPRPGPLDQRPRPACVENVIGASAGGPA